MSTRIAARRLVILVVLALLGSVVSAAGATISWVRYEAANAKQRSLSGSVSASDPVLSQYQQQLAGNPGGEGIIGELKFRREQLLSLQSVFSVALSQEKSRALWDGIAWGVVFVLFAVLLNVLERERRKLRGEATDV